MTVQRGELGPDREIAILLKYLRLKAIKRTIDTNLRNLTPGIRPFDTIGPSRIVEYSGNRRAPTG